MWSLPLPSMHCSRKISVPLLLLFLTLQCSLFAEASRPPQKLVSTTATLVGRWHIHEEDIITGKGPRKGRFFPIHVKHDGTEKGTGSSSFFESAPTLDERISICIPCRRPLLPFLPASPFLLSRRGRNVLLETRGGAEGEGLISDSSNDTLENDRDQNDNGDKEDDNDEERYSRQVYTLGARAHGLIRRSIVYLDGSPQLGLTYEVAKNLALSGIRKLVLVTDKQEEEDSAMPTWNFNPELDDLGSAYMRAAKAETRASEENDNDVDPVQLLLEYIKRLNPSVQAEQTTRSQLEENNNNDESLSPCVYLAVDRPHSMCVKLNQQTRQLGHKFVAVQTAGVFGQVFCDFGDQHIVHDADGENPLVTPMWKMVQAVEGRDAEDGNTQQKKAPSLYELHCLEGEKHDVSKGDVLQFHLRNGNVFELPETMQCRVEKVLSPFLVHVTLHGDTDQNDLDSLSSRLNHDAVAFSRVKPEQSVDFVPLQEAYDSAVHQNNALNWIAPSDLEKSFDGVRQRAVLECFAALDTFVRQHQRCPQTPKEVQMLQDSILRNTDSNEEEDTEMTVGVVQRFAQSCAAKFVPLQCAVGAIAAQECLKAVSGLYTPVQQFLLMDFDEVLMASNTKGKKKKKGSKKTKENTEEEDGGEDKVKVAPGLRYLLGDKVVDRLQSQRLFVVGAGAIGCELLKNVVAMGASCRGKGKLIVTDMDTIEKSNLSRQLLFRDADLGQFKSLAAERAIRRFQPHCRIDAHSSKVGGGKDDDASSQLDTEDFWENQVDVVLNALDNVDARLYMDGQCVRHRTPLVDAGTSGPKGNVQVVLPAHETESYASSADPPEEAIPVCTLKNFPYTIAHTIAWARDLFDGLYVQRAQRANELEASLRDMGVSGDDTAAIVTRLTHKLWQEAGEEMALSTAQALAEDLSVVDTDALSIPKIREHSLQWAVSLARQLYVDAVDDLLKQHPLDSHDEEGDEGDLFWSGTRRPPSRIVYIAPSSSDSATVSAEEQALRNQNLVAFVRHGARLRAETFLSSLSSLSSTERNVLFTDNEARDALAAQSTVCRDNDNNKSNEQPQQLSKQEQVARYLSQVVDPKLRTADDNNDQSLSHRELHTAEFEKDDESNGHIAFVTAASNLRALSYGIPPVSALETRRVAGNIIPAMISTTAIVSALSTLEWIKHVQKVPLLRHKNAFFNLAQNFWAFTAPLPAESTAGLRGRTYTLWDTLSIQESQKMAIEKGGLTMKSLLKKIRKLALDDAPENVSVASVSLGPLLLYANFLHEDDKTLLQSSIWDVIAEALAESEEEANMIPARRDGDDDDTDVSVLYSPNDSVYDLTVVVEDMETGEEAELPPIRLRRYLPLAPSTKDKDSTKSKPK